MQKMARDIVRGGASNPDEEAALGVLSEALTKAVSSNGGNKIAAWDTCFREVYALADAHMVALMKGYGVSSAPMARL